ncbi:MAG: SH3 domain-containing protein [Thermomicrobiales bacterium]
MFADLLNLRSGAGLLAEIKTVVPNGTEFVISSGPTVKDGLDWYRVQYATGSGPGWVAGEYLAISGVDTDFTIGDSVVVIATRLNLRFGPGLVAGIKDTVPLETEFTIVGGATSEDGYDWYEVSNSAVFGIGWVAGEYLAFGGRGGGSGSFESGNVGRTTAVLNVRYGPGLDAAIFRTTRINEAFFIASGTTVLDGYTWYKVRSISAKMPLAGGTGWVAAEFLIPSN